MQKSDWRCICAVDAVLSPDWLRRVYLCRWLLGPVSGWEALAVAPWRSRCDGTSLRRSWHGGLPAVIKLRNIRRHLISIRPLRSENRDGDHLQCIWLTTLGVSVAPWMFDFAEMNVSMVFGPWNIPGVSKAGPQPLLLRCDYHAEELQRPLGEERAQNWPRNVRGKLRGQLKSREETKGLIYLEHSPFCTGDMAITDITGTLSMLVTLSCKTYKSSKHEALQVGFSVIWTSSAFILVFLQPTDLLLRPRRFWGWTLFHTARPEETASPAQVSGGKQREIIDLKHFPLLHQRCGSYRFTVPMMFTKSVLQKYRL